MATTEGKQCFQKHQEESAQLPHGPESTAPVLIKAAATRLQQPRCAQGAAHG